MDDIDDTMTQNLNLKDIDDPKDQEERPEALGQIREGARSLARAAGQVM